MEEKIRGASASYKFLTLVPSYLERIAEALEKISTTLEKMLEVKSEYR